MITSLMEFGVARSRMRTLGLIGALLWCGGAAAAERPRIVVGIAPLKWVVESIASNVVEVTVFLKPGQNPHTFEPSGRQVSELARASAFLYVGLEVESLLANRVSTQNPKLLCWAVGGLPEMPEGHAHDPDCRCLQQERDPHVWLSPPRLEAIAEVCASVLRELLPDQAATLNAGLVRTRKRIREVHAEIAEILKPVAGRTLLVYHPSWGLFARDYGLAQLALEEAGRTPSAKHLAGVVARANKDGVHVLFSNPEAPEAVVTRAAAALGCRVEVADPLAAAWDTNLLDVARRIAAALASERDR
jgi:zinc transport system substrate-binding protein